MNRFLFVLLTAACAVISSPALAQFYTLNGSGLIEGISDNGIAVGSFNSPEYFMWEVGVS
jgi:hypothetical protein